MQPLTFAPTPLSLQEYASLNRRLLWKRRWWYYSLLLLALLLMVSSSLLELWHYPQDSLLSARVILPFVYLLLVLFLVFFLLNKNIKRNYRNTPHLADGATYTLADTTITGEGPSIQFRQPWPVTTKKAYQIGHWVVLYASATTAYFLNLHALEAPATLTEVEAMLQQQGIVLKK
jgi:Mn2+/Fe2+ NRAMP family transporter